MHLLQLRQAHLLSRTVKPQLWRLLTTVAAQEREQAAEPLGRVFPKPLLYRDFIQQSLYHPRFGYFSQPDPPIKRLPQPIDFNRLVGVQQYHNKLDEAYKQLQVDWLTPVEVFAPWYGRALAHYMLELRQHESRGDSSTPLTIVEIGGGTGTLAASILDYVSEMDPSLYSSMSYTTIELSAGLAAAQQQLVLMERRHHGPWRLVHGDASQLSTWAHAGRLLPKQHSLSGSHAFVLMMEVMDNLPHDRVVRQDSRSPWQQVAVQAVQPAADQQQQQQQQGAKSSSSSKHEGRASEQQQQQRQQQHCQYSELVTPATDPLIQRCLHALHLAGSSDSSNGSSGSNGSSSGLKGWLQSLLGLEDEQSRQANNVWLPTRCFELLETLHTAVPYHTLIAADFSALPEVQVAGRNAPLVSGRGPGRSVHDYSTVLVPWGAADIFFPTDFDGLRQLYQAAAETAASGPAAAPAGPKAAPQAAAAAAATLSAADPEQAVTLEPLAAPEAEQQQQPRPQRPVSSSHTSTADFMAAFAEAKGTCTLTGYNPLVQDWLNTHIFVGKAG